MSTFIEEQLESFSEDSIYYFKNRIDSIVKDEDWYRKLDYNAKSNFLLKALAAWYHQVLSDPCAVPKPLDAFTRDWVRE